MCKTIVILAISAMASIHAADKGPLTDAQIVEALITLNDGEIKAARFADKHAHEGAVKNFSIMMLEQHKQNNAELKALAQEDSLHPQQSDLSQALAQEAREENNNLEQSSRSDIDKSYVWEQVRMHDKALMTLEKELLPNAKNPKLRALLEKTETAVKDHLHHAKNLESTFH
jgi:putative membrane protein